MQSFLHNPFGSKPAEAQQSGSSSQSLASILDHDQRSELTLLLNNIIATQRSNVTAIFDPRFAGTEADSQYNDQKTTIHAGSDKAEPSGSDKLIDVPGQETSAELSPEEDEEKRLREAEKRIKELSAPETQDLKKATVNFFDDWREAVLIRVGEVVNSREEAKAQAKEAKPEPTPHDDKKLTKEPEVPTKEDPTVSQQSGTTDANPDNDHFLTSIKQLYPPISTPLTQLPEEKRRLVLHSVLLLLLSLEHYAAHSRILLLHLTTSLNLPINFLSEDEEQVAQTLLKAAEEMSGEESRKKQEEKTAISKKWKVGLATAAGAVAIGITGGLAAPLVAAGIGTVMGGLGLEATVAAAYLGTLASSSVVVGGLFGAYGGKMTGKAMESYAKEVSDFGFVPVHRNPKIPHKSGAKDTRRLRVAIGISGWLTDKDEVVRPWRVLGSTIETFALRFEMEALLSLGNALSILLKSTAWSYAKKEVIKRTILAGLSQALSEALWPLAMLKIGRIVDNPYSIAKLRADKAGRVLADALINRAQGERPVTLVGYSMGARVIYSCLCSLAERKAFGLIENAVLLGTPAPASSTEWRKMRSVVAGRLVNVYSTNDYILAFLYRTTGLQLGVAGLQPADFVKGIENVDVSELVEGHLRYRFLTGSILKRIGFEDLDLQLVEEEEAEMKEMEEMERKEKERQGEGEPPKEMSEGDSEKEAQRMENEVREKNEQSMLGWATEKMNLGVSATTSFFKGGSGKDSGSTGHVGDVAGMALPGL